MARVVARFLHSHVRCLGLTHAIGPIRQHEPVYGQVADLDAGWVALVESLMDACPYSSSLTRIP